MGLYAYINMYACSVLSQIKVLVGYCESNGHLFKLMVVFSLQKQVLS